MEKEKNVERRIEAQQALSLSMLTSAVITTLVNGILTIIKETTPLKDYFKAVFGHHWTGHGVVLFIIFLILSILFVPVYNGRSYTSKLFTKLTTALVASVLIMLALTLGFFLFEFLE